jgi:hypothetical protein
LRFVDYLLGSIPNIPHTKENVFQGGGVGATMLAIFLIIEEGVGSGIG